MTDATTGPRITPLQPPYDPQLAATLAKWMPPQSDLEPLVLFRTLEVHAELASRMRAVGSGILGHGRIDPRDRELVIHRTCARAGAEYEWGVHAAAFGRPLGLSHEQLAASADGAWTDPVWSEHEALLIRLADELHDRCTISDDLWSALSQRYRDDQLLELMVVAGWYRLLSYVINGARIELEPWAERFPAAN
jgi:4-carboxymuconolactone decarboxylase